MRNMLSILAAVVLLASSHCSTQAQNVFWGGAKSPTGNLLTSDLDGVGLTNILTGTGQPLSVDIDPFAQQVFWTDVVNRSQIRQISIRSSSFASSSPLLVTSFIQTIDGVPPLAVDAVNKRLYWSTGNDIVSSDYSGGRQTVILSGLSDKVATIDIDTVGGKVYWGYWGGLNNYSGTVGSGIGRANLDGSSPQPSLLSLSAQRIYGITVDPIGDRLFWSDDPNQIIWQSKLDGTGMNQFLTGLTVPSGLDYETSTGRLYFVESKSSVSWTKGLTKNAIYNGLPVGFEMWDVAATARVPEPSGLVLALFGSLGLAMVRRRRAASRQFNDRCARGLTARLSQGCSVLAVAIVATSLTTVTHAAPTFLVSQSSTLYRYQSSGPVQSFPLTDIIDGMTTVPAGITTGNMNGGAGAGDVLALGQNGVYRLDNPLSAAPTLTQIGNRGGINASPLFVGNRLFGIGGALPDGSYLIEWDPISFNEIGRWATGVFGGPGGLTHVGGLDFLYTEFVTGTLWEYTLGNTFSTAVGTLPSHDYSGLENVGGTLYATFALKPAGTGGVVLGTLNPNDATFNQIAFLDIYQDGITGITAIVPEPSTCVLSIFGLAITLLSRKRS